MQASLPLLTARDKRAIVDITQEFEVDFVALTYTCSGDDVLELREYLDSIGQDSIKIIAKARNPHPATLHAPTVTHIQQKSIALS